MLCPACKDTGQLRCCPHPAPDCGCETRTVECDECPICEYCEDQLRYAIPLSPAYHCLTAVVNSNAIEPQRTFCAVECLENWVRKRDVFSALETAADQWASYETLPDHEQEWATRERLAQLLAKYAAEVSHRVSLDYDAAYHGKRESKIRMLHREAV